MPIAVNASSDYHFLACCLPDIACSIALLERLHKRPIISKLTDVSPLQLGGKKVLEFASVYGFRNIQTLLRKMKQGRCQYDYVEIMACPAGCTNGGGQIKASTSDLAQEITARVQAAYQAEQVGYLSLANNIGFGITMSMRWQIKGPVH